MDDSNFRKEQGIYSMKSFEFEQGKVLKNVDVEYFLYGRPKYDEEGNITNVVVVCHRFNGNHSSFTAFSEYFGEGGVFDVEDYFVVSLTSLGFPNSCSPSKTGLKHNFPNYSIKDRVNFRRQFLKEFLDIDKTLGVMGAGVGGYEVLTWASLYPDEMEFIVVLGSSFKTNGYRYVISKCIDSIIESHDDFYSNVYSESLSRIMVSINRLLYSNYFSKKTFQDMSNDEIDVLMDDFVDDGLFFDIYDFKARNDAILDYDIENDLKNIKAKSLIISSKDDIYYTPEFDTIPLGNLIPNSKVLLFDSKRDYRDIEDYSPLDEDVYQFMAEFKK